MVKSWGGGVKSGIGREFANVAHARARKIRVREGLASLRGSGERTFRLAGRLPGEGGAGLERPGAGTSGGAGHALTAATQALSVRGEVPTGGAGALTCVGGARGAGFDLHRDSPGPEPPTLLPAAARSGADGNP